MASHGGIAYGVRGKTLIDTLHPINDAPSGILPGQILSRGGNTYMLDTLSLDTGDIVDII